MYSKKRTIVTSLCLLVLIPALLLIFVRVWDSRKYYIVSLLMLAIVFIPFLMRFEGRRPQVRELVLIATMVAIAVAGRAAFYWLPQFKPVCAIVIITGIAFNPEAGFITGACAGLISNFFFGQGPWTPWQMLGFGLVGFLAGILFADRKPGKWPIVIYGFFSTLIIYGVLLDTATPIMYGAALNWQSLMTYYISGFPMNMIHASATAIFLFFLNDPMTEKLERIKLKYGILEYHELEEIA